MKGELLVALVLLGGWLTLLLILALSIKLYNPFKPSPLYDPLEPFPKLTPEVEEFRNKYVQGCRTRALIRELVDQYILNRQLKRLEHRMLRKKQRRQNISSAHYTVKRRP